LNSKISLQEHVTFRVSEFVSEAIREVGYEAQMLQLEVEAASNISRKGRMLRKDEIRSSLVALPFPSFHAFPWQEYCSLCKLCRSERSVYLLEYVVNAVIY
jgi:hypothetical protein